MMFWLYFLCAILPNTYAQTSITDGGIPLWKSLFSHHTDWIGFYSHDSGNYDCIMRVMSVSLTADKETYVTFSAEHVTLDMVVYSDDGVIISFREASTWNKSEHFSDHTNLDFTGKMNPYGLYYRYVGNVSSEEVNNFGTVTLRPDGESMDYRRKTTRISSSLKYGLTIGVPVLFAVLLTVTGILIIVWAVKKGYLRHIPLTYKNFRNSSRNSNPPSSTVEIGPPPMEATTASDSPAQSVSNTADKPKASGSNTVASKSSAQKNEALKSKPSKSDSGKSPHVSYPVNSDDVTVHI